MTAEPMLRARFKASERRKAAGEIARWINPRGDKRPWWGVTTATVAA
jgi:hypothetical protein